MTLTFFFSDLEDSSGLAERLGARYAPVLTQVRELQREAVAQAGGEEVDARGDEVFALFSDPGAAAAAALEIQRSLAARAWPEEERVLVRIGLHFGEAERAGGGLVGIDVHRASRICQAGHGGQILLSRDVISQLDGVATKELGEFEFRGLREPERIFQLMDDGLPSEFPPLRNVRIRERGLSAVIAEDSTLLREGLARLLEEADIDVVGQAGNPDELMLKVRSYHPNVAIVDIRMPPTHTDEGLRAAQEIRRRNPSVGILVLSQHVHARYALELLGGGTEGVGYLLKERVSDLGELSSSVERIGHGGSVLDPAVVGQLVGRRRQGNDPLEQLTDREREVLALMAEGRSNKAIGERLYVTEHTVEKHVKNIFQTLRLPPSPDDHRRVLAVVAFLNAQ